MVSADGAWSICEGRWKINMKRTSNTWAEVIKIKYGKVIDILYNARKREALWLEWVHVPGKNNENMASMHVD